MEYFLLNNLTTSNIYSLNALIDKCDGYEPFFCTSSKEDELLYYTQLAAFDKGEMVSFLCLFCLDEETKLYELSGMTAPTYRGKHHFSKLFSMAIEAISSPNVISIIAPVTEDIKDFRCLGKHAYTEYMLSLSRPYFNKSICYTDYDYSQFETDCKSKNVAIYEKYPEIEFVFSEDFDAYMCYLNASAYEPCAVLNLDFQDSFTNIYGVFVDENLRGMGLGFLLMKHFLYDYFNDEDIHEFVCNEIKPLDYFPTPLVLNVSSTNIPATKLYKKCGFTEVSHIDYHFINLI